MSLKKEYLQEKEIDCYAQQWAEKPSYSDEYVEWLENKLKTQRSTFCLISEKDRSFEDWLNNNFEKQGNCFVNKINETVTYSQDALFDIHDFYCDRFIAY